MPKSNEEQKYWNRQAYGFDDIDGYAKQIRDAHKWDSEQNAAIAGVASTLSDAQEMLAFEDLERVRQMLNIAKAVLFKVRIEDRGMTENEYAAAVKKLTELPSDEKLKAKDLVDSPNIASWEK